MQFCFDNSFDELPLSQQKALIAQLRKIAKRYMFEERVGHTLQATALVNEAYINLSNKNIPIQSESHLIAIAARQMRRILVDHARKKQAVKRDIQPLLLTVNQQTEDASDINVELMFLDKLLDELACVDHRSAQAFELKLFSSLSHPEIAELLGTSLATTERDIKAARAWLKSELADNKS